MQAKRLLDASRFQQKLDTLAFAFIERVEHDWPASLRHLPFAHGFFTLTLKLARFTYRTVFYLCADSRQSEYDWHWEYTLILPAINRTLLDSLFNVVFMLEDLEPRSAWYLKSGWRDAALEYERFHQTYSSNPAWTEWFSGMSGILSQGAVDFSVTAEENENPGKAIKPWPNPGRMPNYGIDPQKRPPDREFLQYLNDWFYREHSSLSHLSFYGMMKLGALILRHDFGPAKKKRIEEEFYPQHRGVSAARTSVLLLCLISEMEQYFKYGSDIDLRILEVWHVLIDGVPEAKELYDMRYSKFWPVAIL